jgi:hypothetical protein
MLFVVCGLIAVTGHTKSILSRYGSRKETMRCMALSRYAAMRLEPKASLQELQRVLDMLVSELDLLRLELCFDAGRSRVHSSRASWNPEPAPRPGDEIQLSLKAADGSPVELSFQGVDKGCPARLDTLTTCLASAFAGLNTNIQREPGRPSGKTSPTVAIREDDEFQPMFANQAVS